ncbi:hypothetical protein K523DRAFT_137879 [Schizophyllum commune Tattone D]|nr:hypothetical protein K523DRAFT_137879 [Schizophyllum commune Tattone D]
MWAKGDVNEGIVSVGKGVVGVAKGLVEEGARHPRRCALAVYDEGEWGASSPSAWERLLPLPSAWERLLPLPRGPGTSPSRGRGTSYSSWVKGVRTSPSPLPRGRGTFPSRGWGTSSSRGRGTSPSRGWGTSSSRGWGKPSLVKRTSTDLHRVRDAGRRTPASVETDPALPPHATSEIPHPTHTTSRKGRWGRGCRKGGEG